MGQSITLFCPTSWNLDRLASELEDLGPNLDVSVRRWPGQVEAWHNDWCALRISNGDLSEVGMETYSSGRFFNEEFVRNIQSCILFEIDFHDVDVVRALLVCIAVKMQQASETAWFDTDYGWVIGLDAFLNEVGRDPAWDWRFDRFADRRE